MAAIQKHIQENIRNMGVEIVHGDIAVKKINDSMWIASCSVTKPVVSEVGMEGSTEEEAISNLSNFLNIS